MKSWLYATITDALHEIGVSDVNFTVEQSGNRNHGDYATNAAFAAAQQTGKSVTDCADILRSAIRGKSGDIERVAIAGPGFLNIYLSRPFFAGTVGRVCAHEGRLGGGTDTSEVLIEYMSPNLFKPLHVGNLVGLIVGESLARIFTLRGATVRRIVYPSDIGPGVAKAVWGLKKTGGDPNDITALGDSYRVGNAAYESDPAAKREMDGINGVLYRNADPSLMKLRDAGIRASLRHGKELCGLFGTTFDTEIFESEAAPIGMNIVQEHIADGVFEEDSGAVIFRGEDVGLHTRVFVNSAGFPTYEAKEIGNFSIKNERYPGWMTSLVVTGSEQKEYFNVIAAAIRRVFPDTMNKRLEHVPTGFLTLSTGKMSSRSGTVLTGESVLADLRAEAMRRSDTMRTDDRETLSDQIAVGALKYWILRQRVGSNIVFNREGAFSFEGDSGPYIQYTHARTASLLRKAAEMGVEPSAENPPDHVYPPERLLHQFSDSVRIARDRRSPHHIIIYLLNLAGSFNTWYAGERILNADDGYMPYRIALTCAVGRTLEDGLWALGIPAPERM